MHRQAGAERAADEVRDDLDLVRLHLEEFRQEVAELIDVLRLVEDCELPVLPECCRAVEFDRIVVLDGNVIFLLHFHRCFREALCEISPLLCLGLGLGILRRGELGDEVCSASFLGIFHLDQPRRMAGLLESFRDYEGDRLAVEEDFFVSKREEVRDFGAAILGRRIYQRGHVEMG